MLISILLHYTSVSPLLEKLHHLHHYVHRWAKYNNANQIDPVKPLVNEFKALKKKNSTELMD